MYTYFVETEKIPLKPALTKCVNFEKSVRMHK